MQIEFKFMLNTGCIRDANVVILASQVEYCTGMGIYQAVMLPTWYTEVIEVLFSYYHVSNQPTTWN